MNEIDSNVSIEESEFCLIKNPFEIDKGIYKFEIIIAVISSDDRNKLNHVIDLLNNFKTNSEEVLVRKNEYLVNVSLLVNIYYQERKWEMRKLFYTLERFLLHS